MFASLHIPDFTVVAALRANSAARNQPCAVLAVQGSDEPQEKLPLLAINSVAGTAGLQPGWPLNRALVRCPDLIVMPRDPTAEAGLRAELIELGESPGPDLEVTASFWRISITTFPSLDVSNSIRRRVAERSVVGVVFRDGFIAMSCFLPVIQSW